MYSHDKHASFITVFRAGETDRGFLAVLANGFEFEPLQHTLGLAMFGWICWICMPFWLAEYSLEYLEVLCQRGNCLAKNSEQVV